MALTRLEISLEGQCSSVIRERDVNVDVPRTMPCRAADLTRIVAEQSRSEVSCKTYVSSRRIAFVLQDVDVFHPHPGEMCAGEPR